MSADVKTLSLPFDIVSNIFGQCDTNIKILENKLSVMVTYRDDSIKIAGEAAGVNRCYNILSELISMANNGETITTMEVNYLLSIEKENIEKKETSNLRGDVICHTLSGKPVAPKTIGQRDYVEAIRDNMIVFGIGPAGTGKTYLAMAMAITAFKNEEVSRIILTRPAIEAGEKLGFLPGDLQSKVDPYLRPLYDALYQIMGAESFQRNMEKGLIEVAPLAYMRGRTLDNAFIILDEAQNTTSAQMKMFLTRIGFGSKAVITGDITQKDLPNGTQSGLEEAMKVLRDIEDIKICRMSAVDVVRHPLVQQIVNAYDKYDNAVSKRNGVKHDNNSGRGKDKVEKH